MTQRFVNRRAKDSVFIDVFQRPEYQLQMLRVFHPEMTDVRAEDIQTITLKQVITNHQYNDLAFVVGDVMMVFVEAQSSWSPNIALRVLLYLADTIQEYIHLHRMDIHGARKLKLPKPEFYVIYTGDKAVGDTLSLRRDFFCDADCPVDLTARVYTAETEDIIGQYILFCHVFDQQVKLHGRSEKAARKTVRICMDRDVLREYLQEREKEVVSIMIMLFDQQYATEAYAREQAAEAEKHGRKEGRKIGQREGIFATLTSLVSKGLLGKADAAAQVGMSVEEFEREAAKLE